MPTLESTRIGMEDPIEHPRQLAKTIIVRPQTDPIQTLECLRQAWREVAKFGYADDVHVPLPDSDDDFFAEFPEWYRALAKKQFTVCSYVDDRDWIWWSSVVVGDLIKIDIRCDGMPTDTYPLIHLLEACNCTLLYDDMWFSLTEIGKLNLTKPNYRHLFRKT